MTEPELQPPLLPPTPPLPPESDIVMVSCFVAERVPDDALTVKVDLPALVGVPEIRPDVLRLSPVGRAPDDTDHLAP